MNDSVVEKLLEELTNKIKEAKEIHSTLQTLKKYGAEFELPDLALLLAGQEVAASTTSLTIRPDEFYRCSQTEAAEKYMRKIGHAVPLDDIFNALAQGGIQFGSDGKKNLNTQLTRATRKFAKIITDQGVNFGLLEWYPKKRGKKEYLDAYAEPSPASAEQPEEEKEE